jgi:hypothetical protein
MPNQTTPILRSAGFPRTLALLTFLSLGAAPSIAQGPPRLLGWNDLGMHCMDGDTSIFSILPPFNTFHAQLVVGGQLVGNGYSVTYEAVADPTGSINKTSIGKTDFWQHAQALFGVTLPLDQGLAGFRMPGLANVPQAMPFHAGLTDFVAEGVPVTPYDDSGHMNPYPLMRLVARNAAGQQIAATDIVVPVSAEMACASCHGSGTNPDARPASGWAYGPPATDDRLNILKLHDERHLGSPIYTAALQAVGYSANGLVATAVNQQHPVLCASCHGSNALAAPGQPGVPTMTSAMHMLHGQARLPDGRRLEDVPDRASCYTCHPGADTRCLRGAMGKAIGADGEAMMSCQDCHGSMSEVGQATRVGWLQEPNCQNCHTGDATSNAGAIRFDTAYDAPGHLRTTPNARFATTPNVPQTGFSLYRFSSGHGGLECSACHGSPHAIWPSSEPNDNLQSVAAQGHKGTIVECSTCHSNLQDEDYDGPHGMHPTGAAWVDDHGDVAETLGTAACNACHGSTSRGTVLSRSHADRTLATQFGTKTFWRGYEVGCYDCHNGPNSENPSTNTPPTVASRTETTPTDVPLSLTLSATDPNTTNVLVLRIVEQPRHGAVAFDGTTAVYRAWDGYVGSDSFTYAAADGRSNSNLGTVTISVTARACAGTSATFGYGCALPDGSVPSIGLDGCPTGGQQVGIRLDDGPVGGWAILALGIGRGVGELGADGCTLRIGAVLGTTPLLALSAGAATYTIAVPSGFGSVDLTAQGFCLDLAAARGFVATPGLEIRFR